MSKTPRYPDGAGFKGGRGGTGEAGAIQTAPKLKGRRAAVYDALAERPGTAEQLGARIGLHWYLCRPRLSELKARGLAIETGERGAGAMGGTVNVWRATTAEERALSAARRAAEAEKTGGAQ